ncbi:MAG: VWA domain-containing protein [Xanthomonadales bacterium]|nr:VWA domain-containing protein [Xanthomonadales bacterium]
MMDALPLHFIRPLWLALLPAAVIVPLLWRHLRRPSGDWARICDNHLLRWLSVGDAAARPSRSGPWLAGLGWLVAAVALAGPSWQKLPDSSFASRDARVLVLDLSLSMLAEDLKPNRLTQAHFRLSDMLEDATLEGQTGLVSYAGDAFVVSPLTSDTNTIKNMLPALQPDVIPVAGSRPDRALELAAELLKRSGVARGEILLIADSGDRAAAVVAADLARQGIYTSVLAVGTLQGAPIPSGDGFVSDGKGNIVVTRLQRDVLQSIASAGGGRYSELTAGSAEDSPWAAVEGSEFALKDDALGERWKDAGPWLALVLLPLVAFSFRRGLLFVLPLILLPGMVFSPDVKAGFWDDMWASRDQQAQAALRQERAEDAALLAKDPAIAGEALYRKGDFSAAAQSWSQLDAADSHYNRGNSLARAGELDAAIGAYDAALDLDPGMEDALFNRSLVEQMKQQQEQQQQDQDSEGESSEDQSGEESQQDGEQGEEESSESQQDGEQSEEESDQEQEGDEGGEPSQADMEQNWSEEDAQAMEQWLRRIPDDPGGLLRRKFRNEHQRRGAPADESETW